MIAQDLTHSLLNPALQYGFAGIVVILLAIVLWLCKQGVCLQRETNKVITANTVALGKAISAIESLNKRTDDELELLRDLQLELYRRPRRRNDDVDNTG